jgi:hypothetical protein
VPELVSDPVAIVGEHREDVVDGLVTGVVRGKLDGRLCEQLPVEARDLEPPGRPPGEVAQLDPQDGTLEAVHPVVEPDRIVVVALGLAVVAHRPRERRDLVVIGCERASLAVGTQVLTGVEAPRGCAPERPHRPAAVGRAVRLAGVLEDRDAASGGDRIDRIEVGRTAVEVDRHDRARASGDRGFDPCRVEVRSLGKDVREDRRRAGVGDRLRGRDEGVRGGDDLVARPDPGREEREVQRARPGVERDAVPGSRELGELALERGHLVSEHELAAAADTVDRGEDLLAQRLVLPTEVVVGNVHRLIPRRR